MTALYPYLVAIGGITLMMGVWVLVQVAWRRTFADVCSGADVLAVRTACCGCSREDHCDLQGEADRRPSVGPPKR